MKRLTSRLLALVPLSALLVSCSGLSPAEPSEVITTLPWKLQSFQRSFSPQVDVPNPERFTLRLGGDGRASIRADCNTCIGRYELTGQALRVSALACTRAFCGRDSLDTEFLSILETATTYSLSDGVLTIRGPSAVLSFRQ